MDSNSRFSNVHFKILKSYFFIFREANEKESGWDPYCFATRYINAVVIHEENSLHSKTKFSLLETLKSLFTLCYKTLDKFFPLKVSFFTSQNLNLGILSFPFI